jgi:hypothetical protein
LILQSSPTSKESRLIDQQCLIVDGITPLLTGSTPILVTASRRRASSQRYHTAVSSQRHHTVAFSWQHLAASSPRGIAPQPAASSTTPPTTFASRRRPPHHMEFVAATVVGFSGIPPPIALSPARRSITPRSSLDVDDAFSTPITTLCPSSSIAPAPASSLS